jgi:SAM-dependent methyltransferase
VNKSEVWAAQEDGLDQEIGETSRWGLKSAQDLMAYVHLREADGLAIAEIGGGKSRVLPRLIEKNRCANIEKFEGLNNGPKREFLIDGVENISAYVGTSESAIEPDTFDVLFSISVVEHVDIEQLRQFFQDCARILRPQGRMIHLIDMYLADDSYRDPELIAVLEAYRQPFVDNLFDPIVGEAVLDAQGLKFSCAYLTHPDEEMRRRNRLVPELRELRKEAQSCSLIMIGQVRK